MEEETKEETPVVTETPKVEEAAAPAPTPRPKKKTIKALEEEVAELQAQLASVGQYQEEGSADESYVMPKKWEEVVLKILGPEFQCEFVQPDNGGALFKIIVPKELSNASQLHWQIHNRDVRTKEIGNTGLTGVTEWCLKVRQNLIASGKQLIQYP